MSFSVRTKVLTAYVMLALLVTGALANGFIRLHRIGTRLHLIQEAYLPITKTTNSFFNFYHLDETFDLEKIIANRNNRLFVDSITIANPEMLKGGLERGLSHARLILSKNTVPGESEHLDRIFTVARDLQHAHQTYVALIQDVVRKARAGTLTESQTVNADLISKKRAVRANIDFLARRLDDRINRGIHYTVLEERRAVYWTLGFAVITLILAFFLGFIALYTLRPLEKLKRAAREIAAGDLRQRAQIKSTDEVGELAREFNRMADSIQQRDEALRKQQEQILQGERMAVVGRMASKISHEIRNPLNALGLNIELLSDRIDGTEPKAILSAMGHEIDRLNRVAESYLSMARSKVPSGEENQLSNLANTLKTLLDPECRARGIQMEVDVPETLPSIRGSSTQLQQAFLNLARNAIEASPSGSRFGIRAMKENGSVKVEVWDQGSGIDPRVREKLFEPFFTTKEKGTGLGLSITREIVQELGGTIECRTQTDAGTTFHIVFPVSNAS